MNYIFISPAYMDTRTHICDCLHDLAVYVL